MMARATWVPVPDRFRIPLSVEPLLSPGVVARAEAALAEASARHRAVLDELITQVSASLQHVPDPLDATTRVRLARFAHDLRGTGTLLGAPLVSRLADSFFRLCDAVENPSPLPLALAQRYAQALRWAANAGGERSDAMAADIEDLLDRVDEHRQALKDAVTVG